MINIPRLTIEAVTVSAMLGVIAVLMLRGKTVSDLVPRLSAFAMAAVRLLPSANRISTAFNNISYQEPMLDKMIENMRDVSEWENVSDNEEHHTTLTLDKQLEIQNITYRYPNTVEPVLCNANMLVNQSVSLVHQEQERRLR